jgi:hypothetical protein
MSYANDRANTMREGGKIHATLILVRARRRPLIARSPGGNEYTDCRCKVAVNRPNAQQNTTTPSQIGVNERKWPNVLVTIFHTPP